jgi:hypothetical protein
LKGIYKKDKQRVNDKAILDLGEKIDNYFEDYASTEKAIFHMNIQIRRFL